MRNSVVKALFALGLVFLSGQGTAASTCGPQLNFGSLPKGEVSMLGASAPVQPSVVEAYAEAKRQGLSRLLAVLPDGAGKEDALLRIAMAEAMPQISYGLLGVSEFRATSQTGGVQILVSANDRLLSDYKADLLQIANKARSLSHAPPSIIDSGRLNSDQIEELLFDDGTGATNKNQILLMTQAQFVRVFGDEDSLAAEAAGRQIQNLYFDGAQKMNASVQQAVQRLLEYGSPFVMATTANPVTSGGFDIQKVYLSSGGRVHWAYLPEDRTGGVAGLTDQVLNPALIVDQIRAAISAGHWVPFDKIFYAGENLFASLNPALAGEDLYIQAREGGKYKLNPKWYNTVAQVVAPMVLNKQKGVIIASGIAEADAMTRVLNSAFGASDSKPMFEAIHSGVSVGEQQRILRRSQNSEGRHWIVGVLTQDKGLKAPWLDAYVDLNRTLSLSRMLHRLGLVAQQDNGKDHVSVMMFGDYVDESSARLLLHDLQLLAEVESNAYPAPSEQRAGQSWSSGGSTISEQVPFGTSGALTLAQVEQAFAFLDERPFWVEQKPQVPSQSIDLDYYRVRVPLGIYAHVLKTGEAFSKVVFGKSTVAAGALATTSYLSVEELEERRGELEQVAYDALQRLGDEDLPDLSTLPIQELVRLLGFQIDAENQRIILSSESGFVLHQIITGFLELYTKTYLTTTTPIKSKVIRGVNAFPMSSRNSSVPRDERFKGFNFRLLFRYETMANFFKQLPLGQLIMPRLGKQVTFLGHYMLNVKGDNVDTEIAALPRDTDYFEELYKDLRKKTIYFLPAKPLDIRSNTTDEWAAMFGFLWNEERGQYHRGQIEARVVMSEEAAVLTHNVRLDNSPEVLLQNLLHILIQGISYLGEQSE
ncbi:MAG: hypothetical protein HRT45_14790 [Bdellovibrionales bacterium]|nr:hypothetical protein [Bdellovibrionales bacterium]